MRKHARKTVLIVCEGKRDTAFLLHLKRTYCGGNPNSPDVCVKKSDGKGGNHVVHTLCKHALIKKYDCLVAFTEADVPPEASKLKELRRLKAHHVVADPCLEGLLLKMLGRVPPRTATECKAAVNAIERSELFAAPEYAENWPKGVIDEAMASCDELRLLVEHYL